MELSETSPLPTTFITFDAQKTNTVLSPSLSPSQPNLVLVSTNEEISASINVECVGTETDSNPKNRKRHIENERDKVEIEATLNGMGDIKKKCIIGPAIPQESNACDIINQHEDEVEKKDSDFEPKSNNDDGSVSAEKMVQIEQEIGPTQSSNSSAKIDHDDNKKNPPRQKLYIFHTQIEPLNKMLTDFVNAPATNGQTSSGEGETFYRLLDHSNDVKEMLEKIQARGDCPILENVVPSDGAKYEEFLKEIFNSVNERVGLVNSGSMKLVNGHQKLEAARTEMSNEKYIGHCSIMKPKPGKNLQALKVVRNDDIEDLDDSAEEQDGYEYMDKDDDEYLGDGEEGKSDDDEILLVGDDDDDNGSIIDENMFAEEEDDVATTSTVVVTDRNQPIPADSEHDDEGANSVIELDTDSEVEEIAGECAEGANAEDGSVLDGDDGDSIIVLNSDSDN